MCYPQGMDATESAVTPPVLRYGIRHDPATIQAVAERIEAGDTGEQAAKAVGISPVSVERIVAESDDLRLSRARAREARAEAIVAEGLAIIDAPLPADPKLASAEATRANNRAGFRRWLAGCLHRDLYGDRPPQVNVQVNTVSAAFGRLSSPKSDAADE